MKLILDVKSQPVMALLNQLKGQMGDVSPVLLAVGEDIMERTKQRFSATIGPDGAKWRPNTQATIINYLKKQRGFTKKTGKIGNKGMALAISKRPLQGKSGDLAKYFSYDLSDEGESVVVKSIMKYAAMQQFGGKKSAYPKLWGDIPARPFLPIMPDGNLQPAEESLILESLRNYLAG